jgi:hypothetical protein
MDDTAIVRAERLVLRALSTRRIKQSQWIRIERKLADHCWREPDHAVVYESIIRARGRDPGHWREQLAAEATRMGFPDVDWEPFLGPRGRGSREASLSRLICELELAIDPRR